jgi:LysR family transcriptional regulator, hypochlorite-specific transcription factor HypT
VQIGQCHLRITLCAGGITMDLDWLEDFLVLADEKNLSRAADARNVPQPLSAGAFAPWRIG